MNPQLFKETIENAEKTVLLSHVNPDGDTLGTMLALYFIIKDNFSKTPILTKAGKIPDIYSYLPCLEKIESVDKLKDEVFDLAIAIDIAAKDRMCAGNIIFDNAKVKMNLDHHKTNNGYGSVNFVNGRASCAGEVLFDLCSELNLKISKDAASCLYTSILTDTGGFRFENTNAEVLKKAAKIVELGANPSEISRYCYESKPKPMVMLGSYALSNASFDCSDKIAYTLISNNELKKFNAENDHTEGIVEALRQIKTTEISFVAKEVDEQTTKISLRSKSKDVSAIAGQFGGGGHTFAAGCTIKKPLKIAAEKLLEKIKETLWT